MINILTAILFSLSANIDNIVLGIAYGVKKIHISLFKNFLISLFTSYITIISMKFGNYIFCYFNKNFTNMLGSSTLIVIGVFGLLKYVYCKHHTNICNEDHELSLTNLKIKQLIIIVITLSCNNIAAGFAASAAGIDLIATSISTFIFSFLFIYIGNKLGKNLINELLSKYSEIIGSSLLIIIGIIEYLF